jgi:hypothetical protein
MDHVIFTDRQGNEIKDWRSWPRPKRDYHWEPGRSAMELARSWFTSVLPVCPPEIRATLDSHDSTAGTVLSGGKPEHVTGLPESGEGRNHDLLLSGQRNGVPVIVSVEAKVDETFGERLGKYWKRKRTDKKSRASQRIEALLHHVFGEAARPDQAPWGDLRYQLVTAVAGTAIEAARAGAPMGIVIIHELHTSKASKRKLSKNAEALGEFLSAARIAPGDIGAANQLYGPLRVLTHDQTVEIYLGRAVYAWNADVGAA